METDRIIKDDPQLFITEFARTQPDWDRIHNFLFEGCTIIGPAVLEPFQNTRFIESRVDKWNEDFMFCEKPPGMGLRGAIRLDNCIFERCLFMGTGFAGTPQGIARLRREFGQDSG